MSMSKMPYRFMALHRDGKMTIIVLNYRIFLKIRISYKCKNVKVPNLVYFGSPSTVLSNTNRTIFTYDKVLSIFLNWKVTPIFALKMVNFPS